MFNSKKTTPTNESNVNKSTRSSSGAWIIKPLAFSLLALLATSCNDRPTTPKANTEPQVETVAKAPMHTTNITIDGKNIGELSRSRDELPKITASKGRELGFQRFLYNAEKNVSVLISFDGYRNKDASLPYTTETLPGKITAIDAGCIISDDVLYGKGMKEIGKITNTVKITDTNGTIAPVKASLGTGEYMSLENGKKYGVIGWWFHDKTVIKVSDLSTENVNHFVLPQGKNITLHGIKFDKYLYTGQDAFNNSTYNIYTYNGHIVTDNYDVPSICDAIDAKKTYIAVDNSARIQQLYKEIPTITSATAKEKAERELAELQKPHYVPFNKGKITKIWISNTGWDGSEECLFWFHDGKYYSRRSTTTEDSIIFSPIENKYVHTVFGTTQPTQHEMKNRAFDYENNLKKIGDNTYEYIVHWAPGDKIQTGSEVKQILTSEWIAKSGKEYGKEISGRYIMKNGKRTPLKDTDPCPAKTVIVITYKNI